MKVPFFSTPNNSDVMEASVESFKMKVPFFRTPYNYDVMEASDASAIHFPEPTLCVQSQADDTDINTIVRRFGLTGELPTGIRAPTYGDFTGVFDFNTAANAISLANESFDAMPADVRARFHNDPAEFVDFVSNDSNREEAIKLGLVMPPLEVAPPILTPLDKEV